jgi:alkylation response protein AidB-like acyl-CoA dehydrogenase
MNLELTQDQLALRELFANLFAKEASPAAVRAAEPSGFDPGLWGLMTEVGTFGVAVPENVGGAGAGLLEMALIATEAGRRLAPVPFAEPAAAVRLLASLGHESLVAEVLSGELIVSMAGRPSSIDGQLLLDGSVAGAVLGLEEDRLVLARRPAEVGHLANVGALPMARWASPTVEVLGSGPDAVTAFGQALDEVRVLRAAQLVGLAFEAIEIGAAYARERKAFGIPIGTYQGVAHPLADAQVAADGGELLVWKACWALATENERAAALASMAYVFAAETAFFSAQHSLHIHGGYGFMAEYDIQLYYRRSKGWVTAFADPRREVALLGRRLFPEASDVERPVSDGLR